jgi:hypothetical protein
LKERYTKRQTEKKREEREREADKPGQNSYPFCPFISLYEPNVYLG